MPSLPHGSAVNRTSSTDWFNRKHGNPEDDDKAHFMFSLQAMVSIALEIVDTSVVDLTDDPSTCTELIKRVQKIGKKWDEHPSWPLRGWYVQLLLAIAGLSRVSEFWAEERGFWNFSDEKDETDSEPIQFVAKPLDPPDEDAQLQPIIRSRAPSLGLALGRTISREAAVPSPLGIDLGVHRVEEEAPGDTHLKVAGPVQIADGEAATATHADEAEVLREAVEEVRNATILMELALDGDSFQYLSPVWEDVVG